MSRVSKAVIKAKDGYFEESQLQCLAKVFGPLELCDLLPDFRLQT
jgi:hypothetical protein